MKVYFYPVFLNIVLLLTVGCLSKQSLASGNSDYFSLDVEDPKVSFFSESPHVKVGIKKKIINNLPIIAMVTLPFIISLGTHASYQQGFDLSYLYEVLALSFWGFSSLQIYNKIIKEKCIKKTERRCLKYVIPSFYWLSNISLMYVASSLWAQVLTLGGLNYLSGKNYGASYAIAANKMEVQQNASDFNHSFSFLVFSDPQYEWFGAPKTNIDQANALARLVANNEKKILFATINGDMTAYGHPRQVQKTFLQFYPHSKIKVPTYFGLGNHDYENNLDNCWGEWWSVLGWKKNWCAHYMKDIMQGYITNRDAIHDYDPGSLAYSWDIGKIHFVQIQNNLQYEAAEIGIKNSEKWLTANLKRAQDENKIIIINQHKPIFKGLKKFIKQNHINNICVVFAGHLHEIYGYYSSIKWQSDTETKHIPTYLSGSAEYNTTILVDVHPEQSKLSIAVYKTDNGDPRLIKTDEIKCSTDGSL